MDRTNLLPPVSAVYLIWGATRKFAATSNSDSDSFDSTIKPYFDNLLKGAENDEQEKAYLNQAYPLLMAAMRNVIIIYKGRQLNYSENKSIREAYLESMKNEVNIGSQLKDLLKSIPAITIGGVSGIVIAENTFKPDGNAIQLLFALIFASFGYLARFLYARLTMRYKQINFIRQDYEITNYYRHYLDRMEDVMVNLYTRLEKIHENVFGKNYYDDNKPVDMVKDIFKEIRPSHCPLLQKHIYTNKVTPNRWQMCEVGQPYSERCKYFKLEDTAN